MDVQPVSESVALNEDGQQIFTQRLDCTWDMGWSLRITKLQNHVSYLVSLERNWAKLFGKSLIEFKSDAIEFQPNGEEGVRMRIRIQGDAWIAKFKTYITEVERQEKFNQEKFAQLKINAETKLPTLLTSIHSRIIKRTINL